jgi:hypothetical protein
VEIIGRIGPPKQGRVLISLDDHWMVIWDELGGLFLEPVPLQSFDQKFIGEVATVEDPAAVLALIQSQATIPEPPADSPRRG